MLGGTLVLTREDTERLTPSLRALPLALSTNAPWGDAGTPFHTVMGLGYPGSMVLISSLYLQYLHGIMGAKIITQEVMGAVVSGSHMQEVRSSGTSTDTAPQHLLAPGCKQ